MLAERRAVTPTILTPNYPPRETTVLLSKAEKQELISQEQARFAIIGDLKTKEEVYFNRRTVEISFATQAEGDWKITTKQETLYPRPSLKHNVDLSTLTQELEEKQEHDMILRADKLKAIHDRGIHVFAANWQATAAHSGLQTIFSGSHGHPSSSQCYSEVRLGHAGTADFIGIGQDQHIRIFEFGRGGKDKQVTDQAHGVKKLYRQLYRKPLSPDLILPYIVKYDYSGNINQLTIGIPGNKQSFRTSEDLYEREAK